MRNKKMAKRIAVAMLAAATTFSSVPAAAVFAADTNIEASGAVIDGTATSDTAKKQVTVSVITQKGLAEGEEDEIRTLTKNVNDANFDVAGKKLNANLFDATKSNAVKDGAADALKSLLENAYNGSTNANLHVAGEGAAEKKSIISNVAIKDTDNWSYTVTDVNGVQANITIKTDHTYTLVDAVTTLLDQYFQNTDYTTYKDQNLTSRGIADDLNKDTAKLYTKADGKTLDTISGALTSYGVTISGDETLVKDAAGTLTATVTAANTTSYKTDGEDTKTAASKNPEIKYSFKINLDQKTDDVTTALASAVAAINGATYGDPGSQDNIEAKIAADLEDAGAPKGTSVAGGTYKAATATTDGYWYKAIGDQMLKVTLKYSSASKLSDTDKSIRKALVGATKSASTKWTTGNEANGNENYEEKEGEVYTFAPTSKFSLGLQKKDATAAAKIDDIKAAVEKAVNDQLAADKVNDNGVQVVDVYRATKNGESKAATAADEGHTYVVVSASIRNDFYGWTTAVPAGVQAGEKNATKNYLVDVTTGTLKSVETTALALDDQVVEMTPNANYDSTKGRLKDMVVTINPTVTPENGNDEIKYVVKDQFGKEVIQPQDRKYKDADGNVRTLAPNQFIFTSDDNKDETLPGGGKYTVEISLTSDKNVKASASLTIKDSFNDGLDKTKYYRPAVKWAYNTKISAGVGNDNFGVNQNLSRGQFITWLYKLAEKAGADMSVDTSAAGFKDVASTAYYATPIAWAYQHGIASGTSATTFSPDATVTRAQMVTFLYKLNGSDVNVALGNDDKDATVKFTDIAGKFYTTPVTWAAQNGFVSGTTTTTFSPDAKATRAQAIVVLYNAFHGMIGDAVY